jgi:hypothetical protein
VHRSRLLVKGQERLARPRVNLTEHLDRHHGFLHDRGMVVANTRHQVREAAEPTQDAELANHPQPGSGPLAAGERLEQGGEILATGLVAGEGSFRTVANAVTRFG